MFEVDFNTIYPAEHCLSECTGEVAPQASPDKPVSAPMELYALLSPLRLHICREILRPQVCISVLDSL